MESNKLSDSLQIDASEAVNIWEAKAVSRVKSFLESKGYDQPVDNSLPPTEVCVEYAFASKWDQWRAKWRHLTGSMSDAERQAIYFLQQRGTDITDLREEYPLIEGVPLELELIKEAQRYLSGVAIEHTDELNVRPGTPGPRDLKSHPIYPYNDLHDLYPLRWDGYEKFRATAFFRLNHDLVSEVERAAIRAVSGNGDLRYRSEFPPLDEMSQRRIEAIHLMRQSIQENLGDDPLSTTVDSGENDD